MIWLLVSLGAAVGAATRFLVGRRLDGAWPVGTLVVNVVGSALLGVFSALVVTGDLGDRGLALLGTGFCGGLTTFSTFAVQAADQGAQARWRGASYLVTTLVLSLAACWAGFLVAA